MTAYMTDQWSAQFGGDGLATVPTWNNHNPDPELQGYVHRPAKTRLEPAVIEQAPAKGPFELAGLPNLVASFMPYGVNTDVSYKAPPAPIRRDVYMQEYQRTSGQAVSGQAPTGGIYTGVEEF